MNHLPIQSEQARLKALGAGHTLNGSSLRRPKGGCTFICIENDDLLFIVSNKPVHIPWTI